MTHRPTTRHWITLLCIVPAIAIGLYFLLRTPNNTTPTISQYLTRVYPLLPKPLATKKFYDQLNFYYAPMPTKITAFGAFYCLSWMYRCGNTQDGTVFRNVYPPQSPNHSPNRKGFPANSQVEVMHYGWYHEPSLYFYLAKGSGIFLTVGHTLIANNKIDALKKLGLSDQKILSIAGQYAYPYPTPHNKNTYNVIKTNAENQHTDFNTALHRILQAAAKNTDYDYNRIANSTDYDYPLYHLCRQHHYDTIQLTIQPNDNGGFAYEIMDCRTSVEAPLTKRWRQESRYLSIRNPRNLAEHRPCRYHVPWVKWLSCQQ